MKKFVGILLVALGLFGTTAVKADPIGGACCFGTTVTLEFQPVGMSTTNYLIHLFVNTSGYTGSATDFINAVAVDVSNNVTSATLVGQPPGTWSAPVVGVLNNNNCSATGANFICTQSSSNLALTGGTTWEWIFDVTVSNASSWKTDPFDASVKVNFGPANGIIISQPITLQECPTPVCTPQQIPEPGILSLLAVALIGMGVPMLRRRKAKA